MPGDDERDWSQPYEWFAEAARACDDAEGEFYERVGLGGVDGNREYLRLTGFEPNP